MRAWVACLGLDPTVGRALATSLVSLGIELGSSTEPETPGVLVHAADDPELEATLLQLAGRQQRPIIAVSHEHEVENPWAVLDAGAVDVLPWFGAPESCASSVAERLRRAQHVEEILASDRVARVLVGRSRIWRNTLRRVIEIAHFSAASVLLVGESGTGKELLARLVHDLDPRADRGDLVTLDATAIVPTLSGSELFGHERGAYTGATATRKGAFALANRGTLFLDEIGDLPFALQAELLRVLQDGTYKPVGSDRWHTTSFRLITATHRDLAELERQGSFRRDLYYRLATFAIHVPPLRERPEDVDELASHFVGTILGRDVKISEPVRALLRERSYPGNVRDLCHAVARIAYRHIGPGPISTGDVPAEDRPEPGGTRATASLLEEAVRRELDQGKPLKELRDEVSQLMIDLALERTGGNVRLAAQHLGVTDRALQLRRAAARKLSVVPDATAPSVQGPSAIRAARIIRTESSDRQSEARRPASSPA
jgi:transcriptional regulator with GAF, ATPase, and Fis domain